MWHSTMRTRAMFFRSWTSQPQRFRDKCRALGAAVLAAGLAFSVMLAVGAAQACDSAAGAAATTLQEIAQSKVAPDGAAERTTPEPAAVLAASPSNAIPTQGYGGCCDGASHSSGATCSGAICSWCSATLVPMTFDPDIDARACIQALPKYTTFAFAKPDSVFRPPRFLV